MSFRVIVHPAARQEARRAQSWYDDIAPVLGDDFAQRLLDTLEEIGGNPRLYADIGAGLHRAFLRRFPYQAFYRIADGRVHVLAIRHSHADRRQVLAEAARRDRN